MVVMGQWEGIVKWSPVHPNWNKGPWPFKKKKCDKEIPYSTKLRKAFSIMFYIIVLECRQSHSFCLYIAAMIKLEPPPVGLYVRDVYYVLQSHEVE